MPNSFFKLTSSFEAIHEAPHVLPLVGEAKKTWLHLASPERSFLPDVFQNRFSFAREAASPAISKEAEAMPNGALR